MQIESLDLGDLDRYERRPEDAHKLLSPVDVMERVITRMHAGAVGETLPWSTAASYLRFAPGQLTVHAGGAASFKSTILSQMVLGFCEQGARCAVTSLEEPVEEYGLRLCQQGLADPSPKPSRVSALYQALHERLIFWDVTGHMPRERALAMMRYCAYERGVQHFVFDNVTKVVNPGNDAMAEQWAFIRDCVEVARTTKMHVHLVMHSRKSGRDRDETPTMNDIRGTGTIVDQADQVVMVWRNRRKEEVQDGTLDLEGDERARVIKQPDVLLCIEKAKFGGREGKVGLWRDHPTRLFFHGFEINPQPSMLLGGA